MSQINEKSKVEEAAIRSSLTEFIYGHFPLARRRRLGDEDPLIESGVIDSLGMLDVVAFIESEFSVRVEDDDLTPENFQTISLITSYVEQKRRH